MLCLSERAQLYDIDSTTIPLYYMDPYHYRIDALVAEQSEARGDNSSTTHKTYRHYYTCYSVHTTAATYSTTI